MLTVSRSPVQSWLPAARLAHALPKSSSLTSDFARVMLEGVKCVIPLPISLHQGQRAGARFVKLITPISFVGDIGRVQPAQADSHDLQEGTMFHCI